MKRAKSLALLAAFSIVCAGQPANSNEFADMLTKFATTVVRGWADLDARLLEISRQLDAAVSKGELTSTDAAEFKSEIARISQNAAAHKATGKGMSFTQSISYTREMNVLTSRIEQFITEKAQAAPDITTLRTQLTKQVDDALAAGRLSTAEADKLRAELNKVASIETAMRTSGDGNLTARQTQTIIAELDKVKAMVEDQLRMSDSAIPVITNRRTEIEKVITDASAIGRLSAAQTTELRGELTRIQQMQSNFQTTGNIITGSELLALATELDKLEDKVEVYLKTSEVSTAGLDAMQVQLSRRIDGLERSGRLHPDAAMDLRADLQQNESLEAAYKATPRGISMEQLQKLTDDVDRLMQRAEQQATASNTPSYPPSNNYPPANNYPSQPPLSSQPGGAPPVVSNYTDTRGYWGEPYIATLASKSVIGGFPDGSFRPNDHITRAQFAAIATKALQLPPAGVKGFNDVPEKHWAAASIGAASSAGLVTGFPDGTFRPEDKITRAQALVILAKALPDIQANQAQLDSYADAGSVPVWARPSLSKAATAGIIVSYPDVNSIRPADLASRGEVAALTYQTLAKLGQSLPPVAIGLRGGSVPSAPSTGGNTHDHHDLYVGKVTLRPNGPLGAGDQLVVRATGTAGATATFNVAGARRDVPMTEIRPGVYEGRYRVRRSDNQVNARVTVTLSMPGSRPASAESTDVVVLDGARPQHMEGYSH